MAFACPAPDKRVKTIQAHLGTWPKWPPVSFVIWQRLESSWPTYHKLGDLLSTVWQKLRGRADKTIVQVKATLRLVIEHSSGRSGRAGTVNSGVQKQISTHTSQVSSMRRGRRRVPGAQHTPLDSEIFVSGGVAAWARSRRYNSRPGQCTNQRAGE